MPQLPNFTEKRRLKALAVAISSALFLSSCGTISVLTADIMKSMGTSDEVAVDLAPAAQPRYEEGDTYVFEVNGVQVVETVTEVSKDVVHWGDDNGNTWATLHDPILQPISEIEISRRYSQAALSVFPLQKGRLITFTVFEMPRDGAERRRVETCDVEGAFRITVKAGEFDTYKVRCKRRNYHETLYFAPRVGHVVKFVREGNIANDISELVTHRKKSAAKKEMKRPENKPAMKPEPDTSGMAKPNMQTPMKDPAAAGEGRPEPAMVISKMYIDGEISNVSRKIDDVSGKVDDLSQRVDNLAERIERLPSGAPMMAPAESKPELLAPTMEPEAAEKPAEVAAAGEAAAPVTLSPPKPESEAKPEAAAQPDGPYWGVQVGAYGSQAGAEQAWSRILSNPAAIELNDAKVRYVEMTRKKGGKMYRIIVNSYAEKKAAQAACKSYKADGVDCWAVYIK